MTLPLIGLTASRSPENSTITISEVYNQAVSQAGGAPVLIPLGVPEQTLLDILSRLDGIIFTGGGDIEPARYGAANGHPKLGEVDLERDRVELFLYPEVTRRGLPFLGICRGIQLINVAAGGTLYIDIPDQRPGALKHDYHGYPRVHLAHPVAVDNERLAGILGSTQVEVNSFHHQGVEKLATGLRATAFSPDGLIEALELPGYPFGLAVQWHPECMLDVPSMQNLFRAFIEASSTQKS
jgi:putative glutamine amidotransferase